MQRSSMSSRLWVVVAVCAVVAALAPWAAADTAVTTTAAAVTLDAGAGFEPPAASAVCADPLIELLSDVQRHCPFGAPHCIRNRDCDAYCGAPGFGVCQFWPRCCICAG